jgi:hypothetical protein
LSTFLATQIIEWRCEIAIAGGYLQGFYRDMDRKQWDRAERISRCAREVLTRNHPATSSAITQGVLDLQTKGMTDDWRAEQEAWLRAIQALMCLVSFFGMAETDGRTVKGLQGWRAEASKSLGTALIAAKTAFPREDLERLVEESLVRALDATEHALEEDLRESGAAAGLEPQVLAQAARSSCEEALREVVRDCLFIGS